MSVIISALEGISCENAQDDSELKCVMIDDGKGMSCTLASYGATVLSVKVPSGTDGPVETTVVLDKSHLPCSFGTYSGASCGRVANRINKGQFTLDGETYQLATRDGGACSLHGGPKGFHNVNWSILETIRNEEEVGVLFRYISPDGDESYPGSLFVTARYSLGLKGPHSELRIVYKAWLGSGNATVVNICNHTYWNLSGGSSGSIFDHTLQLWCPSYVPVDGGCIPDGRIASVEGTPFNFVGGAKRLGDHIPLVGKENFGENFGIDHCLCAVEPDEGESVLNSKPPKITISGEGIEEKELSAIAQLCDTASGRKMTVFTTQPGVQVYTANFMPGEHRHSSVALETQHFPDSINQEQKNPKFKGTILRAGEIFEQATVHIFE